MCANAELAEIEAELADLRETIRIHGRAIQGARTGSGSRRLGTQGANCAAPRRSSTRRLARLAEEARLGATNGQRLRGAGRSRITVSPDLGLTGAVERARLLNGKGAPRCRTRRRGGVRYLDVWRPTVPASSRAATARLHRRMTCARCGRRCRRWRRMATPSRVVGSGSDGTKVHVVVEIEASKRVAA